MHNITQETHALYYTGNTRTTLHMKHMHNITPETHALHYTRNTRTTLHREHMQTTLRNRHIKVQIERKLS